MNFFLCNRCTKKSDDNILNHTSSEILLRSNKNLINNSIIEKNDPFYQPPNMNMDENTNETNHINDLECYNEEELQILEYPYQIEKSNSSISKIRPKHFLNYKNKFNSNNLLEQDILNHLNHFVNSKNSKSKNKRFFRNNASVNGKKNIDLERKDTMTDPASVALSSLINGINKTNENNEKKNINNTDKRIVKKFNNINNNDIKNKKVDKNNKYLTKSNTENKIVKTYQRKSKNDSQNNKNVLNVLNKNKNSHNKKTSDYINGIIQKKNLLKNKNILSNDYCNNKNHSLSLSEKNQCLKSYSLNCFDEEKGMNKKRFNNLNLKESSQKQKDAVTTSKKNKNEVKITHKKVSRTQGPIQKTCSSHKTSFPKH